MSCRGLFIAVTDEEVAGLLSRETSEDRVEYVVNKLEETHFGSDRACETDKAWDAIHRAFDKRSLLNHATDTPLKLVVLGGASLHSGEDYIIVLKTPDQVRTASQALEAIDEAAFRARYFAIDPEKYEGSIDEEDFGYSWGWLEEAKQFYRNAASAGHSVVFSVDQ